MKKKKRKKFLNLVPVIIAALIALLYALVDTSLGASLIVKMAISRYLPSKDITIGRIDGTLLRAITFEKISLNNIKCLPPGSSLNIERLYIYANPLDARRLRVTVETGSLKLPYSDKIFFYGTYKSGLLDVNIYSHAVDIKDIMGSYCYKGSTGNLSGFFEGIDIFVTGTLSEPEIKGSCVARALYRWGFSLKDCPLALDLKLKDIRKNLKLYGTIDIKGGSLAGAKTARITLGESRLQFNGLPREPYFDMQGESLIERTKIKIGLKGTIRDPDLRLSSNRRVSKDQLLMMLATNKSWKSIDFMEETNYSVTPGMVADFMDYFLFGGAGARTAENLGIRDFFIRYDQDARGGGIRKTISDRADITYSIEQSRGEDELSKTTQKIGSEYRITEGISVQAERELKYENRSPEDESKPGTDDKVLLKYRKSF
ncbi:MAG: translocation/assembly module TamB domain-containing protein [Candidatus Omnitrophota bacterium]|jgi:hypothetical protein